MCGLALYEKPMALGKIGARNPFDKNSEAQPCVETVARSLPLQTESIHPAAGSVQFRLRSRAESSFCQRVVVFHYFFYGLPCDGCFGMGSTVRESEFHQIQAPQSPAKAGGERPLGETSAFVGFLTSFRSTGRSPQETTDVPRMLEHMRWEFGN